MILKLSEGSLGYNLHDSYRLGAHSHDVLLL